MTSTDYHLRELIRRAAAQRSHGLLDAAYVIIEDNFDRFGGEFSPELLVFFAEAASDLRGRESNVVRALELYDRLKCEPDQFKVRALLARCVYEARLGSETCQLKGFHLLQQLKYALEFLLQALKIATADSGGKYNFLVYNASLVFWDVIRPMCRPGWQKHFVEPTTTLLDKLQVVRKTAGSAGGRDGKKGGGGGNEATIPVQLPLEWLLELTLVLAFCLEDAEKDADAAKKADEANQLLEELLKQNQIEYARKAEEANQTKEEWLKQHPELEAGDLKLRMMVMSAIAHFGSKTNAAKAKDQVEKAIGVTGFAWMIFSSDNLKENCEEDLIKAWSNIDTEFDIRGARDSFNPKALAQKDADRGKVRTSNLKPHSLVDLAMLLRAACAAGKMPMACAMLSRLQKFQAPPGRGRILLDLSIAEVEVWKAEKTMEEDPVSKMLLSPPQQRQRELEARHRAVRLCEQCITTAKRIDEIDLVMESAVVMWNVGVNLLSAEHRLRIHKSLQKCAEALEETQVTQLVQLRVQLHFEVARCEVAQDLLTKGQVDLQRAWSLDYTLASIPQKPTDEDNEKLDPAPYIRPLDAAVHQQLHLLRWKLNLYEEPADPADQVMLLLDQVQKQDASAKQLTFNLLQRGQKALEEALEDLTDERLQEMSDTFEPPPRLISSELPLKPLPHQAPATVRDDSQGAAEITIGGQTQPIRDQKPKSERENAVARAKQVVMLMCRIGQEAFKVDQYEFAIRVCDRAISAAGGYEKAIRTSGGAPASDVAFGPPPIEVDGALLLAEAAYTKALCLSKWLEQFEVVINGIDDQIETPKENDDDDSDLEGQDVRILTDEEKAKSSAAKREMINDLCFGMQTSQHFGQWWMVANGLAHFWNLHLALIEHAKEQPTLAEQQQVFTRVLPEYREALKVAQKYLENPKELPPADFDHSLAAGLTLAFIHASVAAGPSGLSALDSDQLLVVRRLSASHRQEVIARVTELRKFRDKPALTDADLQRLRPEGSEPASAAPPGDKKKAAAGTATVSEDVDRSDLQGYETEVMLKVASIPYAKDHDEAKKLVDQAAMRLTNWEPRSNDEAALTLCVEMWTELGRRCLGPPLKGNSAAKDALMCGIKGLGKIDAPVLHFASPERLRWRGACHGLCGEVFARLVDPNRQEKESLITLRRRSIEQFEKCCEYAYEASCLSLAVYGAKSIWNVALPLLHSAETRRFLIEPLQQATRALAKVKFEEDPLFFVGLYGALFDCYSDTKQWDKINVMLNEAFATIPPAFQRRLWALRMLALSRQGQNVVIAMGKMKESQPKAQALIWLVLTQASSKQIDQLDAYTKAINILEAAAQPDVVEVRMQLADWLVRNGFPRSDALDQLAAGAEFLLEVEEGDSEEDEASEPSVNGSFDHSASLDEGGLQSPHNSRRGSQKFSDTASREGRQKGYSRSVVGDEKKRGKQGASGKSVSGRSAGSRRSSVRSKKMSKGTTKKTSDKTGKRSYSASNRSVLSKEEKEEKNEELSERLFAHHYEALCRIYTTRAQLENGNDAKHSLLSAAYFAVRFFDSTVEMLNTGARELVRKAAQEAQEAQRYAAATAAHRTSRTKSVMIDAPAPTVTAAKKKEADEAAQRLQPPFTSPARLSDWAFESRWPWQSPAFAELMHRVVQAHFLPHGDSSTWVGNPDAFARPTLSFHCFVRLEQHLEESGFHLWIFPVLALHLQLAQLLEEPLKIAVACLARMRLSRVAAQCGLPGASQATMAKWVQELPRIPETFSLFGETLEQVRSQRMGRGSADELDPDWLSSPKNHGDQRSVRAPWTCTGLHAHEVWCELSKECILHGQLTMAWKLIGETAKHANIYGDRRVVRETCIIRASLSQLEGQPNNVLRTLREVSAAEPLQAVQVALMLSNAYRQRRQSVMAEEVLKDLRAQLEAAREKVEVRFGAGSSEDESAAQQTLAECSLRAAQLKGEVERIRAAPATSHEWITSMEDTFVEHAAIQNVLEKTGLQRQRLEDCLEFARPVVALIESKRRDLVRSVASGVLSFGVLHGFASSVSDAIKACWDARDALLSMSVPVEGTEKGTVLPVEVLAAWLDVWGARAASLRRALSKEASAEKRKLASQRRPPRRMHFEPSLRFRPKTLQPPIEEASTNKGPSKDDVDKWIADEDAKIADKDKVREAPRAIDEAESHMMLVSNAVVTLESMGLQAAEEKPPSLAPFVEGLAELGRLHLELAARQDEKAATTKWTVQGADPRELHAMEVSERLSNIFANRTPDNIWTPQPATETTADEDNPDEHTPANTAEDDAKEQVPHEEMGKHTLCRAAAASITLQHFPAARRALEALALEAYGLTRPDASFEFLIWLQSVDVVMQADEFFAQYTPPDHQEKIQMQLLRDLEQHWPCPSSLEVYQCTLARLKTASPYFQRRCLAELPPITNLLLSYVAPLTLVVTFQLHANYMYIAATCSPPEGGDLTARAQQLRYAVRRIEVSESEVYEWAHRLQELNIAMEKELLSALQLHHDMAKQYEELLHEVEQTLAVPIAEELEQCFWPHSLHVDHPSIPKQIMLLPDRSLWPFPFERFQCLLRLVGSQNHSAMSRDFSLHLAAQRVRKFVEMPDGAVKPLGTRLPAKPDSTAMLTDPFHEDSLLAAEDPKGDTMGALHRRLEKAGVGQADRNKYGAPSLVVSPEDIRVMLTDAAVFYYLGFGRFFNTVRISSFASQDLRNMALLVTITRCINESSFRRQTKADSLKSSAQLQAEDPFTTSLVSAFRGVQCSIISTAPVPTCLAMRCFEVITRGINSGKTIAKAMEEMLSQTLENADQSITRPQEGMPSSPRAASPPPPARNKGAPMESDPAPSEPLLRLHTQAAYCAVGNPWICIGEAVPDTKKK